MGNKWAVELKQSRTGEELRSLSRFQVAQRTGFTKILKKYKRWTKDRSLSQAFKDEVSSRPDSLFQLDLGYLLAHYIDVLGALRAVFDGDATSPVDDESVRARSSAARISNSLQQGDELDFDLAISTVPLGSNGNKATYWIHPDHIVEVQVLLLQQMRLYAGSTKPTSRNASANATPGRRQSSCADIQDHLGREDEIGLLILDNAEVFAMKQNAATIAASEATQGNTSTKATGIVRWVSSGQTAVFICQGVDEKQQSKSNAITARTDTTSLPAVLGISVQSDRRRNDGIHPQLDGPTPGHNNSESTAVQQWLAEHSQTRSIASVVSKRTRFVGLNNNSTGGIWATLDREVSMKKSSEQDLVNEDWPLTARLSAIQFPHAILEVRREGAQSASLIQTLDRSHLVRYVQS
jgi:SPX domain protein involved in polyphosphate accumulation